MKNPAYTYMKECNKNGIRIYPVLKYGYYYLEIEFNRTEEFNPYERIRTKPGEIKYETNGKEWTEKILELYEHLYKTKVRAKLDVA
tara:strand:+ start:5035 stop:5292 length:258 start_codon:yes stop_codon:yes gene_type:complete